ncbi:hypothetical protein ASPVEDRAFT_334556 [Aspergillus versicolor CBS 583.65]|uniref:Uncharacterized protein n=1 Tax=Aspergillus versicolor CBS 583.65 TaxID=1036611 RepID=A0A1L9PYV9_ASPVE|nr:uncharacterized protein ASPVEDRAFT_334556 [Aspergillus versicolor CBS 583.65]OJJ06729.1 hypothetical protein ASPVEDRAFT_334556 [Aspergillus versicolor CBS 583.65]
MNRFLGSAGLFSYSAGLVAVFQSTGGEDWRTSRGILEEVRSVFHRCLYRMGDHQRAISRVEMLPNPLRVLLTDITLYPVIQLCTSYYPVIQLYTRLLFSLTGSTRRTRCHPAVRHPANQDGNYSVKIKIFSIICRRKKENEKVVY